MIIFAIRHALPDMQWPERMDSEEFDAAVKAYHLSHIKEQNIKAYPDSKRNVWCSKEKRAIETAGMIFPDAEVLQTELLNEVPMISFFKTKRKLPGWIWKVLGRIQWYFNSERQPESRRETTERARRMLHFLEEKNEDCYLVSHGFFLNVFLRTCRLAGYHVTRGSTFIIRPLEKIRIARKNMFCGGCSVNCLLTAPGCHIGREKASRQGIK